MDENCIFCKIVGGALPAYKVWEDRGYMAILDRYPNIKGQTLVIPKAHADSDVFKIPAHDYARFMGATRKVAKFLELGLGVNRVHLVLEGTGVNHLHAKLYPAIGYGKGFVQTIAKDKAKFDNYPGYVTTLMGPMAKDGELHALQEQLTGKTLKI